MARRKRRKGRNHHHLRPRSRGGTDRNSNLLLIHIDRHEFWHRVFGNRTLDEVIALLHRAKRMKGYHDG